MTEPRDVVLITVDSLRADRCGFMGGGADVTPTLDALAADGLVFENAVAPAPETNGSVATTFTGQYSNPKLESDLSNYTERTREHMSALRTIPQRFSELGYETAGITANPWTSRYFAFDRDFDRFEDTMDDNLSKGLVAEGNDRGLARDVLAQVLNWWQGQDMFMSWESLYDEIETTLADLESPYFCWIFLVDVHMPYFPGDGYRTRSRLLTYPANASLFVGKYELPLQSLFHDVLVQSYDDAVRYTDAFFERFLDDVEGDPLIAVTSDHGEGFGEDGMYGHGPKVSEEALHVPLVVANGPTGSVERPFSLRRLPSLLTALATGDAYEDLLEPVVVGRNYDPAIAVRGRRWRYVWRPEEQRVELRGDDPFEWEPADVPELAAIGRDVVEAFLESERERKRIIDAASDVAASAAL
ncbi:sulfatase [Salinilacihabitans rarus]|uniref:sulfatase n=1 Tax=Salinilacihabitans rarus TaxID=2961596 RepID=UPI0020C8C009|nr:sulfatase [Salinilacihabitans rarus]